MSEAVDVVTEETEVSTTELACVLGITGRRIRQMAEDGQLQRPARGAFSLLIPSSDISSSCPTARWTRRTRSWRRPGAWRRPR